MKKAIIITGNSFRHLKLVETVEQSFDVLAVFSEKKFDYRKAFENNEAYSVVKKHFDARDLSEKEYFGDALPVSTVRSVPKGYVNDPELVQELAELKADVVILFGSSIIKKPLLEAYEERVVNLHLGLSPYYRGSGTNFWPVVDGKPECIGATIHLAVPKVDAGPVLHQVRPEGLSETDSIHDLGNKTIRSAFRVLPEIVNAFLRGDLKPQTQPESDNHEFRRLDLNEESLIEAYQQIESGIIAEYLRHKPERDIQYPVIQNI